MLMYRSVEDQTVEAGGFSCVVPKHTTFFEEEALKEVTGVELDPRWVAIQADWIAAQIEHCRKRGYLKAIPFLEGLGAAGLGVGLYELLVIESTRLGIWPKGKSPLSITA